MIAYFDCFSGISGDMTLGAFVDLGVPVQWLRENLADIPLTGFELTMSEVSRNGIQAKRIEVVSDDDTHSRNYRQIRSLISDSPLSDRVKKISLDIFDKIAAAEAGIHQCLKENVHFHEVGGVDAIVDIVGTALCVEYLNIEKVLASRIPLGSGFVTCRHGTLPVPAPATLEILKGVPVYGTDVAHELVTPTGAAIIVTLAQSFGKIPEIIVEKTAYGAGKRELKDRPNLLRIIVGKRSDQPITLRSDLEQDSLVIAETCIDDMNPEFFGFLMERLFDEGALDVYWIPVHMKKNRPGTMVQVLCPPDRQTAIIERILSETTSTGVRFYAAGRHKLERERVVVDSLYGKVRAKRIVAPDGSVRVVPEYEECKRIALKKDVPIRLVYDTLVRSI